MTARDNGGPAFPITAEQHPNGISPDMGMTLRDYFAAKAMPMVANLLASGLHQKTADQGSREFIAAEAYLLADAMLKARQA